MLWSTKALLFPLSCETLTWEQLEHRMWDELRVIYAKRGQRFWKKKKKNRIQMVSPLKHWHKIRSMDNIGSHPSPTAKPTVSSRRPLRMMHTSSHIRVSELVELDWNSCRSIFFFLWVWREGEAPLWVASVHEHHHINCQYVMRPW